MLTSDHVHIKVESSSSMNSMVAHEELILLGFIQAHDL